MATTTQPALTGGCQCRSITYSSTVLPLEFTNCHCLTCRKLSGGLYLTFAAFPTSALTITCSPSKPNALKTTQYSEMATRTHCAECGSPIGMQYKFQPERISLTAGSIDDESVRGTMVRVSEHIFLAEKAGWFEVPDDGVDRFEGFPESFGAKIEEWNKGQEKGKENSQAG